VVFFLSVFPKILISNTLTVDRIRDDPQVVPLIRRDFCRPPSQVRSSPIASVILHRGGGLCGTTCDAYLDQLRPDSSVYISGKQSAKWPAVFLRL